jgi:hypothetical protein
MGAPQPPDKLTRYKLLAVTFLILTFTTYAFFLDILIPGLPDSSYRLKVGFDLFLIPCLLLAGGQLMIGGFVIFMTVPTVSRYKYKLRMWQSMALGGYLTFLFSLTYVAYPLNGPVYYAAFVGTSAYAILFEVVWAASSIVSAALVIRLLSGSRWKHALFSAGLAMLIIVVSAS